MPTNERPHPPGQSCPRSCLRARLVTNGSAHLLHRLRSASPTSVRTSRASSAGALAPALPFISIATSPFTGAPCSRHSSQRSIHLLLFAVRARRASPGWRRLCFTNGAHAFLSLYQALLSTHWARLELVRRSRLLRLADSAFWCRSPSSFSVCPLLSGQFQPSELASHLSSATPTHLLYRTFKEGAKMSLTTWTNLLRSSSSISDHFSPRSFSSSSRSSSAVRRLRPSWGVLEPCGALSNCSVLRLSHGFAQRDLQFLERLRSLRDRRRHRCYRRRDLLLRLWHCPHARQGICHSRQSLACRRIESMLLGMHAQRWHQNLHIGEDHNVLNRQLPGDVPFHRILVQN